MFELFGGTISQTYGLITFCLPMGGSVQKTWKLMSDRAFFSFFFFNGVLYEHKLSPMEKPLATSDPALTST